MFSILKVSSAPNSLKPPASEACEEVIVLDLVAIFCLMNDARPLLALSKTVGPFKLLFLNPLSMTLQSVFLSWQICFIYVFAHWSVTTFATPTSQALVFPSNFHLFLILRLFLRDMRWKISCNGFYQLK